MGHAVHAADSTDVQLSQTIRPLDCTLTEVSAGASMAANSTCPVQPPTLDSITFNGDGPVFTGKYDAAHSQSFRIRFNGFLYVLGTDPELRVSGNQWTLDLTYGPSELVNGVYTLVIEMATNDGQVIVSHIDVSIQKSIPQPEGTEPSIVAPRPSVSNGVFGMPLAAPHGTKVPTGFHTVYTSPLWTIGIKTIDVTTTQADSMQKYLWIPVVIAVAGGVAAGIAVDEIVLRHRQP